MGEITRASGIEELELSVRTLNCLSNAGLHTVGAILEVSRGALLRLDNFGVVSLAELEVELAFHGFGFPPERNLRKADGSDIEAELERQRCRWRAHPSYEARRRTLSHERQFILEDYT